MFGMACQAVGFLNSKRFLKSRARDFITGRSVGQSYLAFSPFTSESLREKKNAQIYD